MIPVLKACYIQLRRSSHSSTELKEEFQMARTELASYSTKGTALKSEFQSDLKTAVPSSNTHTQPPGRMTTRFPHWQGAQRRSSPSPPAPDHHPSCWPGRGRGAAPGGSAAAPRVDYLAPRRDISSEQRRPSRQRDPGEGVRTSASAATTQKTRHGGRGSLAAPLPVLPAAGEGPQAPSSLPALPQPRTPEGPRNGLAEAGGEPYGRRTAAASGGAPAPRPARPCPAASAGPPAGGEIGEGAGGPRPTPGRGTGREAQGRLKGRGRRGTRPAAGGKGKALPGHPSPGEGHSPAAASPPPTATPPLCHGGSGTNPSGRPTRPGFPAARPRPPSRTSAGPRPGGAEPY